ncbi:hypothetical protein ACOSP7_017635 [Xanthoceras sorbifolium]
MCTLSNHIYIIWTPLSLVSTQNQLFSPLFHVQQKWCYTLHIRESRRPLHLSRFSSTTINALHIVIRFFSFQDMTSIVSSHQRNWSLGIQEHLHRGRFNKISWSGYFSPHFPSKGLISYYNQHLGGNYYRSVRRCRPVFSSAVDDDNYPDDSEDGINNNESAPGEFEGVDGEMLRENLERIVGADDSAFNGLDLATLIRNKYGRSYDVQLIKKEFMGRNLLALNVMWKYMEQRSFPLTEEEYILRLDDVANTLKCWGAVSHIRNSLAKLKERPRIGKAVSIFIDMDESGGRANEWIYK